MNGVAVAAADFALQRNSGRFVAGGGGGIAVELTKAVAVFNSEFGKNTALGPTSEVGCSRMIAMKGHCCAD
jgi:hypothetical protein